LLDEVEPKISFERKKLKREGRQIVKLRAKSGEGLASQAGFTLAELLVVITIILVVGGLSIPSFSRVIDNSRLKDATQKLAAVYQDARIRATQDNISYEVLLSASAIKPAQACIDLDGDGVCGPGDPVTIFPAQVTLTNLGIPLPLDSAQLKFPVVNTENSSMHTAQDVLAQGLAWNSHGLPCQRSSASSPCLASGWVQHLELVRSGNDVIYAAVTVSPTGRVKTWVYVPSGNGNGQWF
jgi:prepilin-type N-terminal cleavage/methylation domain-containing protein